MTTVKTLAKAHGTRTSEVDSCTDSEETNVVVAGSLAIDLCCDYLPPNNRITGDQPQHHTSNPASIRQNLGGVGQNVATALHYLGTKVRLCSSIGDDLAGSTAVRILTERGLQTSGIQRLPIGPRTGQYVAVNDASKNLVLAMADMAVQEETKWDFDASWRAHIDACKPRWLVVDANWDSLTLHKWLKAARESGSKAAYEPVSAPKSARLFPPGLQQSASLPTVPNHLISLTTPNKTELASIHEAANAAGAFDREDWWKIIDSIGLPSSGSRDRFMALTNSQLVDQGVPQQNIRLLPFLPCILTTLGEQGVLLTQLLRPNDDLLTSPESAPYILSRSVDGNKIVGGVYMRLFPSAEKVLEDEIVSVNGVGDTFLGVIIAGLSKETPKELFHLVDVAQRASIMTLKSKESVSPQISALRSAI